MPSGSSHPSRVRPQPVTLTCHEQIRPLAFGLNPTPIIPLCYKHGEACGRVRLLTYKDGALWCEVETPHPEAKRCGAFSISARVDDYTLMDADCPDFYAVITGRRARDFTDRSALPLNALGLQRYAAPASNDLFDL